jgi:hypothetical protein
LWRRLETSFRVKMEEGEVGRGRREERGERREERGERGERRERRGGREILSPPFSSTRSYLFVS